MNTEIEDPLEDAFYHRQREGYFPGSQIHQTTLQLGCNTVLTTAQEEASVVDLALESKAQREHVIRDRIYGDLSRRYWEIRDLQRDLRIYSTSGLKCDLTGLEEKLGSRLSDFEEALRICMEGTSDG